MTTFYNYRRYRQLRIRNAWFLAGMDKVVLPFLRGAVLACVLLIAYGILSHTVEANQTASSGRTTAQLEVQAAYIKNLEGVLAKCLSGGDHPITIGDEVWFCGAINVGVKVK